MATQTQIQANRQNAQKSTGPQTPEGKAAVAQNALKHGLTAVRDVVVTENQEDFDLHRDALLEELSPQGPMEQILADRIVSLSWRLIRAGYIHNQTINAIDEHRNYNMYGKPRELEPHQDPNLPLGRIAFYDFSNERVLDHLIMYERRIENSLYKTSKELTKLKKQNTKPRPAPIINNHSSIINPSPRHPEPARGTCSNNPTSEIPMHIEIKNTKNKPNLNVRARPNLCDDKGLRKKTTLTDQKKQTQSNPISPTGTTSEIDRAAPTSEIPNPTSEIDRSRKSQRGQIPMNIGIRSTLKALRHIP